ncbi:neuroligin-3-like [Amphibalanus amphitrite]|uniref:neuroligin-3-like n=1 Tax=Amphibalanus amphitrite TaxID=1232801 RepID=UPI001C913653|nr:neuroligin-3-like [Amphibalanus amphitrite]
MSRGRAVPPALLPLLLLLAAGRLGAQQVARREIVIGTRLGRLQGRLEYAETFDSGGGSRYYYAFRGIPYARPPIGDLRWAEPRPAESWSGTLDARSFRDFCPQYDVNTDTVEGQEDCLYLNVFTPFLPGQLSASGGGGAPGGGLLPVLVVVHGGDFVRGAASLLGPQRLMREDVVLVTLNYRLGVLGFMSSGYPELAGNYGLLDVIQALSWVRDAARDFAGDPSRVTLVGHGAGAAMAHILMLSPRAKGLFQRVVLQSGSSLCPWSVEPEPYDAAALLSDDLDCGRGDRDCLLSRSAQQLVSAAHRRMRFVSFAGHMRPVVDAALRSAPVLPAEPRSLLEARDFTQLPLLAGLVRDEALQTVLYQYLEAERPTDGYYMEHSVIDWTLEQLFSYNFSHQSALVTAVKRLYLTDLDYSRPAEVIPRLTELLTDAWYTTCHDLTVRLHAAAGPVYSYLMAHRVPGGPSRVRPLAQRLRSRGLDSALLDSGVSHGDDLLYLFRSPISFGQHSASDNLMSEVLTTYWANFARTGAPTVAGVDPSGRPAWTVSSSEQVAYYNLSVSPLPMLPGYRAREAAFWLDSLPLVEEEAGRSYAFQVATWTLLALCLLLAVALAAAVAVCIARGRKDGYDSDDVISKVMRSVRSSTTG